MIPICSALSQDTSTYPAFEGHHVFFFFRYFVYADHVRTSKHETSEFPHLSDNQHVYFMWCWMKVTCYENGTQPVHIVKFLVIGKWDSIFVRTTIRHLVCNILGSKLATCIFLVLPYSVLLFLVFFSVHSLSLSVCLSVCLSCLSVSLSVSLSPLITLLPPVRFWRTAGGIVLGSVAVSADVSPYISVALRASFLKLGRCNICKNNIATMFLDFLKI